MEEYLTQPLPTLSHVREESLSADDDRDTFRAQISMRGTSTSPNHGDDTATIIQWQAAHLLSKINPQILKGLLTKLPGASSKIGEIPIIKSYMNLLLLLHEEDSEKQWITRIPYDQQDRNFLIDQVEPLLRAMKRFTGFRVPKLYQYGLARDVNNKLSVDYMLLNFIDGRQMPLWTETYPAWRQKEQILEQLANIYVEMFSKPATYGDRFQLENANNIEYPSSEDFDSFDLPPTVTASMYLHRLVDDAICGKFQRLLEQDALEVCKAHGTTMVARFADLLTLLLMRALIPSQVIGEYNDSPFYITHPDLHNRNIIIDNKPASDEPIRPMRVKGFSLSNASSSLSMSPLRARALSGSSGQGKLQQINIVGIVDWDAAHPVPLQCSAIYPKFLETLPGAEFPDLPPEYKSPNLEPEKELFLDIFSRKELAVTGDQVVTDLIRYGSWERDFFTVSLRRGDVRSRWFEQWRKRQTATVENATLDQHEFSCESIQDMRDGLRGFLSHDRNRLSVDVSSGWGLVAMIAHRLETFETTALENSWRRWSGFERCAKIEHVDGCTK